MKKEAHASEGSTKSGAKPTLSDSQKNIAVAALALIAIAALAFVFLSGTPKDTPTDMNGFVARVYAVPSISLFFDVRGADYASAQVVYQCGVDLVGGKLFGPKTIDSYACDDSTCLYMSSSTGKNATLTYDQVRSRLLSQPYVVIKPGAPATRFYENHMEVDVDKSFNVSCKIG